MDIQTIFNAGISKHNIANVAYPLTPQSFDDYRIKENIPEFIRSRLENLKELNLYVHIPFCKTRCKFCEYVIFDDNTKQDIYVDNLIREIESYSYIRANIIGHDIGGGTPLFLSTDNLIKISSALRKNFSFSKFTSSIETTPLIAAEDIEKLSIVNNIGYKRISMGIQSVSDRLLNTMHREGNPHIYSRAADNIRAAGFEEFNIDLMYGFKDYTGSPGSQKEISTTIRYAVSLEPEYITLYRVLYKGTKIQDDSACVDLDCVNSQYESAFRLLEANGYHSNYGSSVFSKTPNIGTSDYITNRGVLGKPYLGLGLGAQSFVDYLSYNDKQEHKSIPKDVYDLPIDEQMAKMICVSFYYGLIDLNAFNKRFGKPLSFFFEKEFEYLLSNNLMQIVGDILVLTNIGFNFINGIIPLFYSERSKKELFSL